MLMKELPAAVTHAFTHAPAYRRRDPAVVPEEVRDRRALAKLRLLRKSELAVLQKEDPPFGGLVTVPAGQAGRLFASPGGVFELEARRADPWRGARALHAAGMRSGDVVHVSFNYHLTPAASMVETAAHALGCAVIPGGTAPTDAQAAAVAQFRATGYGGTPSFLKVLLDRGAELGLNLSSLTRASVTAEALPSSLRQALAERGVRTLQWYGTADAGLIAYETPAMEGLVLDEDVILEVVRPGTGDPLPDGEVGEVVVTVLSPEYPLLRFATGDLSAVLPGTSPCGRTNVRIRGWMGRADQSTKVRGLFVHPSQLADLGEPASGAEAGPSGGEPAGRPGRDDAPGGGRAGATGRARRRPGDDAAGPHPAPRGSGAGRAGLVAQRWQGDRGHPAGGLKGRTSAVRASRSATRTGPGCAPGGRPAGDRRPSSGCRWCYGGSRPRSRT